jgi:uncharacterized membrane protein
MSLSKRWVALGVFALLFLQVLWHAVLAPAERVPVWLVTSFFALPWLLVSVLVFIKHRTFAFWAGTLALFYFSHGVMEAWTQRDIWLLGMLEAVLCVGLIIGSSWDGMKARFSKKQISVEKKNG